MVAGNKPRCRSSAELGFANAGFVVTPQALSYTSYRMIRKTWRGFVMAEEGSRWTPKMILALIALLLVVFVVGYNLMQGVSVTKIDVPGILSAEFGSLKKEVLPVSPPALEQTKPAQGELVKQPAVMPVPDVMLTIQADAMQANQNEANAKLAQRIEILEQQLTAKSQAQSSEFGSDAETTFTKDASIDLAGVWNSDAGQSYVFGQDGPNIFFQELNPLFGVTAEGSGTLQGNTLYLQYQTALWARTAAPRLSIAVIMTISAVVSPIMFLALPCKFGWFKNRKSGLICSSIC